MKKFAFVGTSYDQSDIYETGEYENLEAAVKRAKNLTDKLDEDIEVWELSFVIQTISQFGGPSIPFEVAQKNRDDCISDELSQLAPKNAAQRLRLQGTPRARFLTQLVLVVEQTLSHRLCGGA
jgi:hypothetical protein